MSRTLISVDNALWLTLHRGSCADIFDAVDYVDKMDPSVFPAGTRPEGLAFVHFPIVDCDVVADGKVLQLAKDLVSRMKRGENMYGANACTRATIPWSIND